jgi:hypothetical protein
MNSQSLTNKIPLANKRYGLLLLKTLPILSAVCISVLFIYAAYSKLTIYKTFVYQLNVSPLKGFENILAWLVPAIEIIIPFLFLIKRFRLIAHYSAFYLMLLFTTYVFIVPHFFSSIETCACGGIISNFTWKDHFYFNLAFTGFSALGLIVYTYLRKQKESA